MKISYNTKEESNKLQREDFLKLSGAERIEAFFDLCYRLKDFPQKEKKERKSDNFVIVIKDG